VKLKTSEFIVKANKKHNNKYDYRKTTYINAKTKIIITCLKHGDFEQLPNTHLRCGCPKCSSTKLELNQFIVRANKKHNNKYDYSKVQYINIKTKVIITCPEHEDFEQTPHDHFMGRGCPKCAGNIKLELNQFIVRANKKHNNKYDYSKVQYINTYTKVIITCLKHGDFKQAPQYHLAGSGCPKCGGSIKLELDQFILKSHEIHNNKYDYGKTTYINIYTRVIITCPKHSDFEQTPTSHLSGSGCPKCANESAQLEQSEFIMRSNRKHNNKYDYSKVQYINSATKVIITCPRHSDFEQTPGSHLRGGGCPICKESHGEEAIANILRSLNLQFKQQWKFKSCQNQKPLPFDFAVVTINGIKLIEYQGRQHYKPSTFGSKHENPEEMLVRVQEHDRIKREWCQRKRVSLLEIPFWDFDNIDAIVRNFIC